MISTRFHCLALCAVLLACRDEPPKVATVSEALPNLPLPPSPEIVSRAGGPDALQITVRTPAPAKQVADYYRDLFHKGDWRLVNDTRDADGATVLLAHQHGQPLWVRIRDQGEGKGTVVELSGAVVATDTTTQVGGSSRSSNRSVAGEK